MIKSINFGEVFRHKEKEFVFLAKTAELVYAAEILNLEISKELDGLFVRTYKERPDCAKDPLFCYIVLKKEDFKERAAFLGRQGEDEERVIFNKTGQILSKEDLNGIRKEILSPESAVSRGLKELIKGLDIKEV